MLPGNFFNANNDERILEIVEKLCREHAIFRPYFSLGDVALTSEQLEEVKNKFLSLYPDENLEDMLRIYKVNNEPSECSVPDDPCNGPIYDPMNKKYYNPNVLAPIRKSKAEVFNVSEFLREAQRHPLIYLNFDTDQEIELDVPYEEKKKNDIFIEYSLKGIAKLALIFNQKRELPYSLIEIVNCKYVY